jgi:hypothetical protein
LISALAELFAETDFAAPFTSNPAGIQIVLKEKEFTDKPVNSFSFTP